MLNTLRHHSFIRHLQACKYYEYLQDFVVFGIKEARACVFAGSFFFLLFISHHITFGLYRYDFLFVSAVLLQTILLLSRVETLDEFKTILLFHVLGFALPSSI